MKKKFCSGIQKLLDSLFIFFFFQFDALKQLCKFSCKIDQKEEHEADVFILLSYSGMEGIVHLSLANNLLAYQMQLICSGEKGPTYKGAKVFHKKSHLLVDYYMRSDNVRGNGDIILGILDNPHIRQPLTKRLVIGSRDENLCGSFSLSIRDNCSEFDVSNVMGKVTGGFSFIKGFAYRGGKIKDCGLVIEG